MSSCNRIWPAAAFTIFLGGYLTSSLASEDSGVSDVSEGVVTTTGGSFTILWKTNPSPMPMNDMFDLLVSVKPRDGGNLESIWLRADARMPEHNHGMNTQPRTLQLGGGTFAIKGFLFHMSGNWDLVFDVALGAVNEQATVRVRFE